jgi:hypothetical protein
LTAPLALEVNQEDTQVDEEYFEDEIEAFEAEEGT